MMLRYGVSSLAVVQLKLSVQLTTALANGNIPFMASVKEKTEASHWNDVEMSDQC